MNQSTYTLDQAADLLETGKCDLPVDMHNVAQRVAGHPLKTVLREIRVVPINWEDPATGARIERTSRVDVAPSYAVRMHGNCLSRDGEWELEPMPSNRDEEFLARHRWTDFEEAEKALRNADYSPFFAATT